MKRSVHLNSCSPRTLAILGYYLALTGSPEEGRAHVERALRVSPCDPTLNIWYFFLAVMSVNAERWEEALEEIDQSIGSVRTLDLAWAVRVACLVHLDRLDEARAGVAELHRITPTFDLKNFDRITKALNLRPAVERALVDHLRSAGLD